VRAARAQKDREKKMAKALLSGSPSAPVVTADPTKQSAPTPKKKVTFSESSSGPSASSSSATLKTKMEWGDVVAAMPSSSSRRLIQIQAEKSAPMKMDVVERIPTRPGAPSSSSSSSSSIRTNSAPDSDDESESDSSTIGEDRDPEFEGYSEEEEIDPNTHSDEEYDSKKHAKEIASEYARRRKAMTSEFSQTLEQEAEPEGPDQKWDREVRLHYY
jgi:hypothetical protein